MWKWHLYLTKLPWQQHGWVSFAATTQVVALSLSLSSLLCFHHNSKEIDWWWIRAEWKLYWRHAGWTSMSSALQGQQKNIGKLKNRQSCSSRCASNFLGQNQAVTRYLLPVLSNQSPMFLILLWDVKCFGDGQLGPKASYSAHWAAGWRPPCCSSVFN